MGLIYNIAILTIYLFTAFMAMFSSKARHFILGRFKIYTKELNSFIKIKKPCIWFHCSSMGEYEDAKQIIDLTRQNISYKILITFYSSTGYCFHQPKTKFAHISYLPFDFLFSTKRFVNYINPQKLIVCRNDIWPNLLNTCKQLKVPTYLVDYSINSRFHQFWIWKSFFKIQLSKFDLIAVQNNYTLKFLTYVLDLQNVKLIGNTRFDCLGEFDMEIDLHIKSFVNNKPVLIFGSAEKNDLKIVCELDSSIKKTFRIIIVEHEPSFYNLKKLKKHFKKDFITYSELVSLKTSLQKFSILYIDKIGILKKLYYYSQFAFIGGGFSSKGIHNILEPAIAANYIFFGPNHRNYQEALDLIKLGGCSVINNSKELELFLIELLKKNKAAIKNQSYVLEKKGASALAHSLIFTSAILNTGD